MRWLSPLEPNNRHQDVRTGWSGRCRWGVGFWKQANPGSGGGVRAGGGDPGVGKTYLRQKCLAGVVETSGYG